MLSCFRFFIPSFFLLLVGCSVTEEVLPGGGEGGVTVWEQPHTAWMGLQGNVHTLHQETWEAGYEPGDGPEEEPAFLLDCTFDEAGRLLYYNPTGVLPLTRWMGVDASYASYAYDSEGRLSEARQTMLGEEQPVVYSLSYAAAEERYVPLPFALGSFDFFCVKGLQHVESDGALMACWTADDTFAWTVVTAAGTPWEMREETSWRYTSGHEASSAATAACSSLFPVEALVQVYRRGELFSSERTELEFAADGSLAATVRTLSDATTGELLERVTCRYQTACVGLPLAWSETQDGEGNVVRREYTYDAAGWLREIVRTSSLAADEAECETFLYASPDEAGNWLVSWQEWNDRVDWNHVTASVKVHREISYFP